MQTEMLITMSNGVQFKIWSELPFDEAARDIFDGSILCQVGPGIILNTIQIASVEEVISKGNDIRS